MYCLIPILSPLTENKEGRNILWGIVIVIAMFKSILIPLSNIFGFTIPEIASNFIEINGYLIFVILGYLLSVMDVSRVKRIIIYIIGILSVIIRYGYTYCMSINANMLIDHLFDYTSLLSVFLAVSVFLLIKNISWDKLNEKKGSCVS